MHKQLIVRKSGKFQVTPEVLLTYLLNKFMNDSHVVEGHHMWISNTGAVLGWFRIFNQHLVENIKCYTAVHPICYRTVSTC